MKRCQHICYTLLKFTLQEVRIHFRLKSFLTGEFFAVCEKVDENGEEPGLLTNGEEFNIYQLKLDQATAAPAEVGAIQLSRGDFISDILFRQDGTLFAHLNEDYAETGNKISRDYRYKG